MLSALVFVLLFSFGLAERGVMKGVAFVVASIALLVFLVAIFVFYPVGSMLVGAFQDFDGSFKPDGFSRNIQDPAIWSLGCVMGGERCGVAWRTLWLAIMTAGGSNIMGLAFASLHPHALSLQEGSASSHRSADHHAALRHRLALTLLSVEPVS